MLFFCLASENVRVCFDGVCVYSFEWLKVFLWTGVRAYVQLHKPEICHPHISLANIYDEIYIFVFLHFAKKSYIV